MAFLPAANPSMDGQFMSEEFGDYFVCNDGHGEAPFGIRDCIVLVAGPEGFYPIFILEHFGRIPSPRATVPRSSSSASPWRSRRAPLQRMVPYGFIMIW